VTDLNASPRWVRALPPSLRARIAHRPNLQEILANTSWLFADKILRMGVGLLVGVWIARYLGPRQYGLLNYAVAFAALFGAVATLGLDSIVMRELVRCPDKTNELLGTAFVLKLLGGVLTLLISTGMVAVVRYGDALTIWLVAISAAAFVFQSVNVIEFYFQAKVQSRFAVIAGSSAFALVTVVKILVLLCSGPLIAFAIAGLGEIALTSLFLMFAYQRRGNRTLHWRVNKHLLVKLLLDSWPLLLAGLAVSL
jgi:O-antigen/teichoic acid export membrane protein